MLSWLRSAGRGLAGRPAAQLVVAGLVLALAFPADATGAIGMAILGGALGVAVLMAWPHAPDWLRAPPARATTAFVIGFVIAVGVAVFRDVMSQSPDWPVGDWGPQHAVLAGVMPSLPGFDLPVWNHAVSTGDAPLELYPSLGYLVTGYVALALGLTGDLPHALMVVAVVVHIAIAAATAALAIQVAPRPLALVIGLLMLVDSGAVAHGGTVGLFRWALLHSALALGFATLAAVAVAASLRRPRLATSVTIWIAMALATAAHPAGLIAAAAAVIALAAACALGGDAPPRRAVVAAGHVALGVALGAALWMPLAARILDYGQHFPNPLRAPARLLEDLLAAPSPVTAFAAVEYAGYFGVLAALWSRRAVAVFVAASGFVLLLGLSDAPYLALELAPGLGVARLGTERLAQLARPFVWAASGYGLAIIVGHARAGWRAAPRSRQLAAAAVLGLVCAATFRALPSLWASASDRASSEAQLSAPDPAGRAALERWARDRMREMREMREMRQMRELRENGPHAWARALFEQDTHEHFHLTATTGLPSFHMAPQPDLLLRERIEDTSPASLARFNVRWVIGFEQPPSLGDPATEIRLGSYYVREVAAWDGKFARIEHGPGAGPAGGSADVTVIRLDDRAVEVEVTGTTEPVLVALGTGYYPRWRARHASGALQPVHPYPAIPGGRLHVVAAWLAPGRTTFTADGPLPSDGDGRLISLAAVAVAAACIAIWSRARWRVRVLRQLARLGRHRRAACRLALRWGLPLALVALVVRGCLDHAGVTRALVIGGGLRAAAGVEARQAGGAWQTCDYTRVTGTYDCPDLVTAYDATASLLNDAPPSWAFVTPAIVAYALSPDVEIRIRLTARLSGAYHAAVSEGSAELRATGEPTRTFREARLDFVDRERQLEVRSRVPMTSWAFTFVHEDTLVPPRPFLAGPPDEPPAAVRAIR